MHFSHDEQRQVLEIYGKSVFLLLYEEDALLFKAY